MAEFNATKDDILACQFHNWFPTFEKLTMKSKVVALSEEFVRYLLQDGVVLPTSVSRAFGNDELSDDDELTDVSESVQPPSAFSELSDEIRNSIRELGGEVFVKLNWSAPIDVSWLSGGSLKCQGVADVFLQLKSSDRIVFDIEHIFDSCESKDQEAKSNLNIEYKLVLRKWANLNPAMEFRLFVYLGKLRGICQRECSSYFDFLVTEKDELEETILDFFDDHIDKKFPLESYTVDIYIDRSKRIWIVDFGPFGHPTSPLMFDWEELIGASFDSGSSQQSRMIDESIRKFAAALLAVGTGTETGEAGGGTEETETELSIGEEDISIRILPVDSTTSTSSSGSSSSSSINNNNVSDSPTIGGDGKQPTRDIQPVDGACDEVDFRVVMSRGAVLSSTKGASRGPIDVTAAPDFHMFMEICRKQQNGTTDSSDTEDD